MNTTITVPFHGTELYVIDHNGEPYTPMKPIVDGMGMDWKSQFIKIKQRFAKGMVEITIPSSGGPQKMLCLALRKLAAWLNTISPNKVRPEIRERVIQYQNECDDVLYEYWTTGEVKRKSSAISNPITSVADGRLLLTLKDGKIVLSQVLRENEYVATLAGFLELAKKADFFVINKDDLLAMMRA